jgi:hypothetical protein
VFVYQFFKDGMYMKYVATETVKGNNILNLYSRLLLHSQERNDSLIQPRHTYQTKNVMKDNVVNQK